MNNCLLPKYSYGIANKMLKNPFIFNRTFYKSTVRYFSLIEKLNFTNNIQILDLQESDVKNEAKWMELLTFYLEKDRHSKFFETLEFIINKNVQFSGENVNKILSKVYNKSIKSVDSLYEYILDNEIQLDSFGFYYLIMSNLKYRGFSSAYSIFVQANLFQVPQNLTVIVALYSELYNEETIQDRFLCKTFIDSHVEKYYSKEVIE